MKTGWSTSKFELDSPQSLNTELLGAADTESAGVLLRAGKLVVIPTETVYGLAADASNDEAVRSIFAAKGRPQDNPLIVHVASVTEALDMIPERLRSARRAIQAFAPGPLTVVIPATAGISPVVQAGLTTVALRVPAHPGAAAIIAAAGVPVAAPSANRSGRPSPTSFAMARWEMEGRVSAIVDGGDTDIGIESTVVDGTDPDSLRVLRPGSISAEELSAALQVPVYAAHYRNTDDASPGRSPGTRYRHYQPAVPVIAFHAEQWGALCRELDSGPPRDSDNAAQTGSLTPTDNAAHPSQGARARALLVSQLDTGADGAQHLEQVMMGSLSEYAQRLYREFRRAEEEGVRLLYVEIPRGPASSGLRDRILRAAGDAAPKGSDDGPMPNL